jgi:acyl-CoA thioesterase FadM
MSVKNSITMATRISDLDSLRHVNNRIYEQLCAEGRFRLLESQGYPLEALLAKGISLRPIASFVKFALQQKSGATMTIQTEAFLSGNGIILWNHHISQADGKSVCEL